MKKYFNLIVALVVMLFAGQSFAYTPPPAPAQGWYIVDQTGKLSEAQKTALNQKIEQVSKTTKNEFGILLLQTMEGNNIEDVAYATFNAWGVGKRGLDNGCLIVVSLAERKTRIETGKGVGGEVTDLQAKQILDNNLKPFLKQGDFAGGFNSTLDALSSLIESRHKQAAAPASDNTMTSTPVSNAPVSSPSAAGCALAAAGVGATDDGGSGLGWFVVLLGVGGFVVWRLRASSKRRAEERARQSREYEEELAAFEEQQRQLASKRREAERLETANRLERERVAREARHVVVPPAPPVHYVSEPKYVPPAPRSTVVRDVGIGVVGSAAAGVAAAEDSRRQRERDDEDRRQRQRDDDNRRSSSSSSSSDYGFGGSSSSGGGGFDGGSSGGGGASGDW